MINKKTIHILVIFAVIATNLFFGLPRVAQYTAGDETLWSYDRVPKFWRSVAKGNWRGTNLCDKPGITLAIISGVGLPFIPDPRDYEKITRQPKTSEQLNVINNMYFYLRLPIYLFTLASLFFFYFLLKRLLSANIALLATIFIGLSPILLGISLIINTDAILWILMPLALLSFLIYQKEPASSADRDNKKFLYLSGLLLGLAILDKFVANFMFPFLLILIFVKYILSDYAHNEDKIKYFTKSMRDYLILIAIALTTIFVFYPSAWIKPKEILNTTIYSLAFIKMWPLVVGAITAIAMDIFLLKILVSRTICDFFSARKTVFIKTISLVILLIIAFVFLNTYWGMRFSDFEKILSDPKSQTFTENFLSAFYPLLFGNTPIVTLLFLYAITLLAKIKKVEIAKNNVFLPLISLALFILIYYLANSITGTGSTTRYQIVNYPIAAIIAAIGLYELIKIKSLEKYFTGMKFYLLVFFIFIISIISLNQTKPFFLAYSSALLPAEFTTNLKDMGDGSWEISQYLNSLANASSLSIWSDKKQVCEKFVGKCNSTSNQKYMGTSKFDYLVSSRSGTTDPMSINTKSSFRLGADIIDARKLYAPDKYYDFKVSVNGRKNDFIKVVNPNSILAN